MQKLRQQSPVKIKSVSAKFVVSEVDFAPSIIRYWWLYLLECRDERLYAGISPDVEARFAEHCKGKGAKFTCANPPLRILAVQPHASRSAAAIAEYRLKKLSCYEKLKWAQEWAWRQTP